MKNYKDKKQKFFLFKNQKKLKKTINTSQNQKFKDKKKKDSKILKLNFKEWKKIV